MLKSPALPSRMLECLELGLALWESQEWEQEPSCNEKQSLGKQRCSHWCPGKWLMLNWTNSAQVQTASAVAGVPRIPRESLLPVPGSGFLSVSAPALPGMCCHPLHVSLPLELAPLLPRVPDSPLAVPAPAPPAFPSRACLPAALFSCLAQTHILGTQLHPSVTCCEQKDSH